MEEQNPNLAELKTLEGLLSIGNYEEGITLTLPSGDEREEIYAGMVRAGLAVIINRGWLGGVKYQLTDRGRQEYQEIAQKLASICPLLKELTKTKD